MIRLFLAMLTILFLVLAVGQEARAQLKPAQSQYLKEVGFLKNPGFEQGYKGWTVGGTCSKSLVSDIPYLNKSLKLTCVNQSFSIKQETTDQTALSGQQGSFGLQIKVNFDGTRVTQLAGGARTNDIIVNANSSYQRLYTIPFILNPTSNGLEVYSDINITGEIVIDNVEFGLAPDGFVAQDLDDTPVGTVLAYGSETIPQGYLLADGSCYLKNGEYSGLYDVIGISGGECTISTANDGFNVPNLENAFLRGRGGARTAFDTEGQAIQSHFHLHGNSNYTTRTGRYGFETLTVDTQASFGATGTTDTARHLKTSSTGGGETRPANTAVVYIIKAKGRPVRNIVAQKSLSPDKAGFIYFSAMDSEITGFLKADGSCILESAYPDFIANTGADTFGDCQAGPTPGDGSRLPDLVTNNRFIRAAGGSLAVGTTQGDAIRNITGTFRVQNSYTNNPTTSGAITTSGTSTIRPSPGISTSLNDTLNFNASNVVPTANENRPYNIALTPYVRMVNADIIRGSFEQIKTDDLVEVIAYQTVSDTLTDNVAKKISYNVEIKDNFNVYANGVFTCPNNSNYQVSYNVYFENLYAPGSTLLLRVLRTSGTTFAAELVREIVRETNRSLSGGSYTITCDNVGDTWEFQALCNEGDSSTCTTRADLTSRFSNLTIIEQPDTQAIVKNLNDNATHRLGDCKYSILDETQFNSIHSGSWVRLEGQSISGSDIANRFGITTLPDAVSNGAFIRQVGGNSAAIRTFQDDAIRNITGNFRVHGDASATASGAFTKTADVVLDTWGSGGGDTDRINFNAANVVPTANENRPKNIALNFYCLVSE